MTWTWAFEPWREFAGAIPGPTQFCTVDPTTDSRVDCACGHTRHAHITSEVAVRCLTCWERHCHPSSKSLLTPPVASGGSRSSPPDD